MNKFLLAFCFTKDFVKELWLIMHLTFLDLFVMYTKKYLVE